MSYWVIGAVIVVLLLSVHIYKNHWPFEKYHICAEHCENCGGRDTMEKLSDFSENTLRTMKR